MAFGRRHRRPGLAVVVCLAILLGAPVAFAQQQSAQRLSVAIGQTLQIPLADVSTVMVINELVAEVAPSEDGFTVRGKSTGDTIVQVFTASSLRVYVVVVQPPPPGPPGPPPPPNIAERGPIKTFWADHRYQLRFVQSSLSGHYFDHLLSFHGRVHEGEYRARGQFTTGDLGNRFQHGTISWTSDRRDFSFEIGDTSGRLYGNSLAGGIGLRGLRTRRSYHLANKQNRWGYELFVGEVVNMADVHGTKWSQPAVGGSVDTSFAPKAARDLQISLAASALAYSTARLSDDYPGQTGVIVGAVARAARRNGLGFELRSGLSAATDHKQGARTQSAVNLAAAGRYQDSNGSQRVEYEYAGKGFASPQSGVRAPGSQRASASFSRTIRGITGLGGASYAKMNDLFGNSLGALSYRFGATIPVHRQTSFTVAVADTSTPMPLVQPDGERALSTWSQTTIGARLEHTTEDGRYSLQSEIDYLGTRSSQGDAIGTTAILAVQRRRLESSKWEGAANLNVTAAQTKPHRNPSQVTSVLAVDQPPLNLGATGAVQARFVQGPFQSFGGLGLQTTELPEFQIAPMVNLGIQFTPTSAHQLVANFSVTRWAQSSRSTYSASVNYTHRFGDSIRAAPIFEFMSYGVVEGRVCYDENSDGLCGSDEPPLPNVPLILSNGQRTVSDRHGDYRFERVKPGFYHLEVDEAVMRERGRPTTILAASFDLPVRGEESHHFAVARACRIRGHVLHDLDLDGQGALSEPLFAGPLVIATGTTGTFQARVNNLGTFAATVPCGEYDLEIDPASLPPLYSPGDDEPIHVATTPSSIPSPRLLVYAIRTVAGEVFLDRNGNGRKDKDEPIVADAVVRFGDQRGISDETGAFLLRRLPVGKGVLTVDPESLPAGMHPGPSIPLELKTDAAAIENLRVPVLPAN